MTNQSVTNEVAHRAGPLTDAECRELLGSRNRGRVALSSDALPVIVPVEYAYDDGAITITVERESALRAAASGDVLAFEIDDYDPRTGEGWSVHALGRANIVTTVHRAHALELPCEVLHGRRLSVIRD